MTNQIPPEQIPGTAYNSMAEDVAPVEVRQPQPVPANAHVFEQHKQASVKQARDRTQYVREQKGHSLILHLLFGWIVLYIPTVYFAFSPNHYYHA